MKVKSFGRLLHYLLEKNLVNDPRFEARIHLYRPIDSRINPELPRVTAIMFSLNDPSSAPADPQRQSRLMSLPAELLLAILEHVCDLKNTRPRVYLVDSKPKDSWEFKEENWHAATPGFLFACRSLRNAALCVDGVRHASLEINYREVGDKGQSYMSLRHHLPPSQITKLTIKLVNVKDPGRPYNFHDRRGGDEPFGSWTRSCRQFIGRPFGYTAAIPGIITRTIKLQEVVLDLSHLDNTVKDNPAMVGYRLVFATELLLSSVDLVRYHLPWQDLLLQKIKVLGVDQLPHSHAKMFETQLRSQANRRIPFFNVASTDYQGTNTAASNSPEITTADPEEIYLNLWLMLQIDFQPESRDSDLLTFAKGFPWPHLPPPKVGTGTCLGASLFDAESRYLSWARSQYSENIDWAHVPASRGCVVSTIVASSGLRWTDPGI